MARCGGPLYSHRNVPKERELECTREKVPGTLLIGNLSQLHVNWLIVEIQIWRPHDDQCCPTNAKDGENPEEKSIEHHGDKLPVFFHLKEKKETIVNMMTLPVSWEPYL